MTLSSFFRLFHRDHGLKQNRSEIDEIKHQSSDALDATVKDSVAYSKQAGEKFDKIGVEMQSMADDITIRIAKATKRIQQS